MYPSQKWGDAELMGHLSSYYHRLKHFAPRVISEAFDAVSKSEAEFFPPAGHLFRECQTVAKRQDAFEDFKKRQNHKRLKGKASKTKDAAYGEMMGRRLAAMFEEEDRKNGWTDDNPMPVEHGVKRMRAIRELWTHVADKTVMKRTGKVRA